MCLYPKLIKNPKYKSTKKNGGNIPTVSDERITIVPIGCGNCIECRKKKSREWQVRLMEDIKQNKNAKFITLTFSTESIIELTKQIKNATGYQLDNGIATIATRRFLERWRKKYKKSLRHWLITEIGHNGTENIHLHGIIWTEKDLTEVEKIWGYGIMWKGKKENDKIINYVNAKTVNYIVKYVTKQDIKNKTYKPIILTSAGIGGNYTQRSEAKRNKYKEGQTREYYRTEQGNKIALPIYWRNKIYTEEEREKLWIEKLDKQTRYVMGEKISIKENETDYYRTLEYYQKINTEQGYGNDQKDWNKEQYERERRMIKQKERIQKKYKKNSP